MLRKTVLAIAIAAATVWATMWPATADAQPHRAVVVVHGGFYYDPFFYDPWFGPWGPWYPAPYAYGYYPRFAPPEADIRVLVKPNKAEVYVDGYYAGIVDDFDGVFQRLRVPPGQHEITIRLEGYRTVHQRLSLANNQTYKLKYNMEPLAPGETTEPPPAPPNPPPVTAMPPQPMPRRVPPRAYPPPEPYPPQAYPPPSPRGAPGAPSAAVSIRIQPAGAEVTIDGERWQGPEGDDRLIVQLSEGPHRVEIQKSGYRRFTTEIELRPGETVPLNVSLTPER